MHTGSAPRAPSGSATAAVFETYDKAWSDLPDKAAKGPLRWRDIPWPMVVKPRHTEELDNKLIANFVLSPLHSPGKEGKDRLRSQLLRWHPDRFESKWLSKCAEDERAEIQRGVGFVVRCLNELMSAQNSVAAGAL
ncbi:hypothetical protein BKA62DRAFT_625484 [Auriculariales sp. MPI-PUGE-AT-0066]|nr:hypothetical protein BKA62DRAFT_625484 [Auriculariales sp. MPI-PUGE-AT-0066]